MLSGLRSLKYLRALAQIRSSDFAPWVHSCGGVAAASTRASEVLRRSQRGAQRFPEADEGLPEVLRGSQRCSKVLGSFQQRLSEVLRGVQQRFSKVLRGMQQRSP
eukprot:563302-Pyramimonas_sp.AAC.1